MRLYDFFCLDSSLKKSLS